jgi:hypothetical protein
MQYVFLTLALTILVTFLARKCIEMTEDFEDYRQIAFGTPLKSVPFWVERWNKWVIIHELSGEERSELLDKCTEVTGKKAKVNVKRLYPMLVVLSVCYPDQNFLPSADHPHYHEYPGVNGVRAHPKAGQPVFTLRDIGLLNQGSGAVLELLNKPAAELSGLREEDIEEKKEDFDPMTVESTSSIIE